MMVNLFKEHGVVTIMHWLLFYFKLRKVICIKFESGKKYYLCYLKGTHDM